MSLSKTRWGYSSKAAIKMKTSPQHFQWVLHVALSLTKGGVTTNLLYEIFVECIVKPWPGHQGPMLHCFDSGDFALIYV